MSGALLAVSSSAGQPVCALRRPDGDVLVAGSSGDQREALETKVEALFRTSGVPPSALRGIVVDVGPGSYTGLRIAVTFARTLAEFTSSTLWELTSLELLACAARERGGVWGDVVRVVLDARRGRFHTGRLLLGDSIGIDEAPRAIDGDSLLDAITPGEVVVAEESVLEAVAGRCAELGVELVGLTPIDASDLFAPDLVPREVEPVRLAPLYLMGSYAEEP